MLAYKNITDPLFVQETQLDSSDTLDGDTPIRVAWLTRNFESWLETNLNFVILWQLLHVIQGC